MASGSLRPRNDTLLQQNGDVNSQPQFAPQQTLDHQQQSDCKSHNAKNSSPSPDTSAATPSSKNPPQDQKKEEKKPPGGFDKTPLPASSAGYTVKFSFQKASNLPVADFHHATSDPFLTATLTTYPANVRKRHPEDPDLVYRTRPVRRSTEPAWNESWIVANVPPTGFRLKCRLYDEDYPSRDDRLGNVTVDVHQVSEDWVEYADVHGFRVKKRAGDFRAYFLRALTSVISRTPLSPTLFLAIEVLGKSDPPHGHMYTVGPTRWIQHFSPMIGHIVGTKVNKETAADIGDDAAPSTHEGQDGNGNAAKAGNPKDKKFDFEANEIQLSGPVPPELYHRFVEFRPLIGLMFMRKGIRGKLLNGVLQNQQRRVYNFDTHTQYGTFEPRSRAAALQFLKMAHFGRGGSMFTYVLSLDGLLRFTQTGKEFGIDMLSKHSLHSNVSTYIACSGEFFIRKQSETSPSQRLDHNEHSEPSHRNNDFMRSNPSDANLQGSFDVSTVDPSAYRLFIDNDSGTYRPEKSILPYLKQYLKEQFPGLHVTVHDCGDEILKKMKKEQQDAKKHGTQVRMVLNRSPSSSSFSSDDESRLDAMDADDNDNQPQPSGGFKQAVKALRKGKASALETFIS